MSERRRVVITGLGTVNPLALNMAETWERLLRGESGIGPITLFDPKGLETRIAGEVKGFDPLRFMDPKTARRMDRFSQLGVAAGIEAFKDSGIILEEEDRERFAVMMATGIGGLNTTIDQLGVLNSRGPGRVSPLSVPMLMPNAAAGNVSMVLGLKGPVLGIVSACAAGGDAIGTALAFIRAGWADYALAGGTEAPLTPLAMAGFINARALSTKYNATPTQASRPFDRDRDGFVLSEGAAALVLELLERAQYRGARTYAELSGYGSSGDAYHITAPDAEGAGLQRAMRAALNDAGFHKSNVDYINAHGTSTPLNDRTETTAIKKVYGERAYMIPISSTKSMHGHLAGAAAALEAAICAKVVFEGVIPPTINYENPDPECDLDYVPNKPRRIEVMVAQSNTAGFGGHNSSIVLNNLKR